MNSDRYVVEGIVGLQVRTVTLDGGVIIHLGTVDEKPRYRFCVMSPGQLVDPTGTAKRFDPLDVAVSDAGLIGCVLGHVVAALDVRTDGSIRVSFSNGVTIFVPFDNWEAWTLDTPAGQLISVPGGGLG